MTIKNKIPFIIAGTLLVLTIVSFSQLPILKNTSTTIPTAQAVAPTNSTHYINMTAVPYDGPNNLYAYQMNQHLVKLTNGTIRDITSSHSSNPTIPGPTIVIKEGDDVYLTIKNSLPSNLGIVGVHVHGIHYDILSDGTLKELNSVADEGAPPPYKVHWIAGLGTNGTWPYHDHTLTGVNGLEYRGLFGMLIINPASGNVKGYDGSNIQTVSLSNIAKDYVIYARDDSFWGQEIDNNNKVFGFGKQTPLAVNPALVAKSNTFVRWNIIPLGTDSHTFSIPNYSWIDPGTSNIIKSKNLGPLENHVFTIKAKSGNTFLMDSALNHFYIGEKANFLVKANGGPSSPGLCLFGGLCN